MIMPLFKKLNTTNILLNLESPSLKNNMQNLFRMYRLLSNSCTNLHNNVFKTIDPPICQTQFESEQLLSK